MIFLEQGTQSSLFKSPLLLAWLQRLDMLQERIFFFDNQFSTRTQLLVAKKSTRSWICEQIPFCRERGAKIRCNAHLLLENAYENNLLSCISKVDYLAGQKSTRSRICRNLFFGKTTKYRFVCRERSFLFFDNHFGERTNFRLSKGRTIRQ